MVIMSVCDLYIHVVLTGVHDALLFLVNCTDCIMTYSTGIHLLLGPVRSNITRFPSLSSVF